MTSKAWSAISGCDYLCRPLRGRARSHRDITRPESGDIPVGAGVPAKRLAQAMNFFRPCAG
ncbi:hypothetical protein DZC31_20155 [Stenotrophomonas rhizophila]|nr:hypothetical protein DZC31_20155 [Stenotrophomonas rhizophila]